MEEHFSHRIHAAAAAAAASFVALGKEGRRKEGRLEEVEEKVKKDVWRNRVLSPHVYAIAKCSLGLAMIVGGSTPWGRRVAASPAILNSDLSRLKSMIVVGTRHTETTSLS